MIGKACERALWYDFRWATPRALPRPHPAALRDRPARGGAPRPQPAPHRRHRARGRSRDRPPVAGRGARRPLRRLARCGRDRPPRGAEDLARRRVQDPLGEDLSRARRKDGVQRAKPQHWAQMQIYMHLTGLTRAMYVAVCKDTDDLTSSGSAPTADAAERLLAKAGRVIDAPRPPARISEDPAWWRVPVLRPSRPLPRRRRPAERNCRSCLHSTPVEGGWHCARWDQALVDQRAARAAAPGICSSPISCPARPVDAGDDHVVYRMRDGTTWIDGRRAAGGGVMLTLRPYQQAAIDAIYGYFAEKAGHPLVVIPTAGGKGLVHGRLHRGRAARLARPAHPRRHPRPRADRAELRRADRLWPRRAGRHLLGRARQARPRRAHPVRRHPVDPPPRLRRAAVRPGADRRGAPDPRAPRTPCTAASSTR